jgi:hypothetical protein
MSTLFTTDFEGYADGEASLLANGWLGPVVPLVGERCQVVSSDANSGTKSVMCGNDLTPPAIDTPQSIHRAISPSGSSVACLGWAKKPILGSNGLQILFYFDGDSNPGIQAYNTPSVDGGEGVQVAGPLGVLGTVNGLVAANTYYSMRLQMHMSTVHASHTSVNSDGCVSLYVNGSVVLAITGAQIYVTDSGWASNINYPPDFVQIGGQCWLDDVTIDDDVMVCGFPAVTGSLCCGDKGTVHAPRAVLFSLDGNTNTNTTPGLFKIAGDLEVTGAASLGVTTSSRLDGLGT